MNLRSSDGRVIPLRLYLQPQHRLHPLLPLHFQLPLHLIHVISRRRSNWTGGYFPSEPSCRSLGRIGSAVKQRTQYGGSGSQSWMVFSVGLEHTPGRMACIFVSTIGSLIVDTVTCVWTLDIHDQDPGTARLKNYPSEVRDFLEFLQVL